MPGRPPRWAPRRAHNVLVPPRQPIALTRKLSNKAKTQPAFTSSIAAGSPNEPGKGSVATTFCPRITRRRRRRFWRSWSVVPAKEAEAGSVDQPGCASVVRSSCNCASLGHGPRRPPCRVRARCRRHVARANHHDCSSPSADYGAGVRPWRRMMSAILTRSGGPPAAASITAAASRKYCGPIAAGVMAQRAFTSWLPALSNR